MKFLAFATVVANTLHVAAIPSSASKVSSGIVARRSTELLEVVQAETPARTSYADPSCQQVIFEHEFASSYGIPYVGTYTPPENCTFTTTVFNISVTSAGRQYDRLALLFFGDTEIWRTSTAMPSETGIFWNYQKDMTIFDTLLRTEQKVIFDLNNVYSDLYTGAYNVTLEALYYNDNYATSLTPADMILPISALASSQNISSVMSLPDDNGTVALTFPRNTKSAVVSIMASGNGAEEFWYTNVPSEYTETFPDNEGWLYGYSPFREVELLIDGQLAGVSWPFPILFSGGVDPGLWRPIVGIDTYDLPSFEIDVTPFLPILCDGNAHNFSLKVVAYDSAISGNIGTVGENWYVTGAVFVWVDEAGNQTTGSTIESYLPSPAFQFSPEVTTITSGNTTTNTSLYFELTAQRTLSISSTIQTSEGLKNVSWTQSLSFQNIQNMTNDAYNQSLSMVTTGNFSGSYSNIQTTFKYPLNLYSYYIIAPSVATLSSVQALIDRSLLSSGISTLPYLTGTSTGIENLATRQNASSMYYWNETIVEGTADDTGITEQWYSYAGTPGNLDGGVEAYSRYLKEVDDAIVDDEMAWAEMEVPETVPLPLVVGEPTV